MITDLFNSRKTTRVFNQDPLPTSDVQQIIDAALLAPSKNCIFPYRIEAYTQSELGRACKQHIYRNVCQTEWDIAVDEMPYYDFDRTNITTPNIHMFQVLDQLRAPIVLAFIGEFIDDQSSEDGFFSDRESLERFTLSQAISSGDTETVVRIIRDTMLACSWAQSVAQELGYDTAFVGNAGQHDNQILNLSGHIELQDGENCIIFLCIGHASDDVNDAPRCVASEYIQEGDTTTVVFHERTRPGEAEYRNAPTPTVTFK
jgi:nitroreductase